MVDWATLILRIVLGLLLAGHGAQKLFGWFGGSGIQGTAGFMESLGLRPGRPWAILAGLAEFVGGLLVLLGLLSPIGPLAIIGSMAMATVTAHWGKPIWAGSGGAELPVTNAAIAVALILTGPGYYSLDQALAIQMPDWVLIVGIIVIVLALLIGWVSRMRMQQTVNTQQTA